MSRQDSRSEWNKALMVGTATILASIAISSPRAFAAQIPNNSITPGQVRTDLTEAQIKSTKWGKDHRLVTTAMKTKVYRLYHMKRGAGECAPKGCEVDHRFPRSLGGADVIKNLWPQPYSGPCNAHDKDRLEDLAHKQFVTGKVTLATARSWFADDWRKAYRKQFHKSCN